MRISTPLLYQQAVNAMSTQQSDLLRLQQQISAGKRMLTAADDPVAAAQALVVRQSSAQNDRFTANIDSARDLLGQNDSTLASITEATVKPSGILWRKMARKITQPSQLDTMKPEAMAIPSKNV